MATIKHNAERLALSAGIDYALNHVQKNPRQGMLDIIDLVEKHMPSTKHDTVYTKKGNAFSNFRRFISDPTSKWVRYGTSLFTDIDPKIMQTFILNLGFEAGYCGLEKARTLRDENDMNVPWVILFDPTSACNMHCTGCWSAEYGHKMNLTFEEMDRIVTEGKQIGVYFYMMTGGEPLVRKADVLKLCRKHKDCIFGAFTNGTLVDEQFCKDLKEVRNLFLNMSLEGFREQNDARRGAGSFDKVMTAMDLLKKNKLLYGTSICYTSQNYKTVVSDEFMDLLTEKGCKFSWYFHYMPVGNDASVDLLPTAEQRKYMYNRIRDIRSMQNPTQIMPLDFQNDGEFVGGCIAAGKNYLHINANGDVEPCVFIHYSSANIKEVSLFEALKQPLFTEYHKGQAFNENMLRPCPMLENPEILEEMVKKSGAKSTDLASIESAEHLCGKCKEYAEQWKPVADSLWERSQEARKAESRRLSS
jgi:MoaA/NifB/PqqE/SkfB family radical SAM enzyme